MWVFFGRGRAWLGQGFYLPAGLKKGMEVVLSGAEVEEAGEAGCQAQGLSLGNLLRERVLGVIRPEGRPHRGLWHQPLAGWWNLTRPGQL